MIWLIAGAFYLLLVSFFLGAFALPRRADDQAQNEERRLEAEKSETTHSAIRIHRLLEVDKTQPDTTASPIANDAPSNRRMAG